jgi:hypothetical protein
MVVLEHPEPVQILNHYDCLGFRQSAGELMQRVGTLIRHSAVEPRALTNGLLAVAAAFHFA